MTISRTELTVLRAAHDALEAGTPVILKTLTAATGLPEAEVRHAVRALQDDELVVIISAAEMNFVRLTSLTPAGRRTLRDSPAHGREVGPENGTGVTETWTTVEGPALFFAAAQMQRRPRTTCPAGPSPSTWAFLSR